MTRQGTPVFVCQTRRGGQPGPIAPWITMASWAQAAADRHEHALVLTVEGTFAPSEALVRASSPRAQAVTARRRWRRSVPEPVVTLAKDVRRIAENHSFSNELRTREIPYDVPYVFQLHG